MTDETTSDNSRSGDLIGAHGPMLNIFGEVRWPKDWTLELCQEYIKFERNKEIQIFGILEPEPNGNIACMEYSLDPKGLEKPDHLGHLKKLNPNVEFPETYPDGTPSWVDKEHTMTEEITNTETVKPDCVPVEPKTTIAIIGQAFAKMTGFVLIWIAGITIGILTAKVFVYLQQVIHFTIYGLDNGIYSALSALIALIIMVIGFVFLGNKIDARMRKNARKAEIA